ncbi:MAG: sugar phosphate nucleotidyltransferase [Candidatus Omnitrophica bacterium]|nr:sugar phosphate nucleotidyltransferase [Candidatus Omnitrophota bacterium]
MTYCIILAGGVGSRFWPLSRYNKPKQFLKFSFGKSLIAQTLARVAPLAKKENIYIATNKDYARELKSCLKAKDISGVKFFYEAQGRNTFPSIAVLTKRIYDSDKDALILVCPSDHCIEQENKFLKGIRRGLRAAESGWIVTLGVVPLGAETGYGYIQTGVRLKGAQEELFKVRKFIEKPSLEKARKFIKHGGYYWNAGIFIFRARVLLEEIRKVSLPDYRLLEGITGEPSLKRAWTRLSATSIDYAVMEKTDKIALIPAEFPWSDLGSWKSLEPFMKKDIKGNIMRKNSLDLDSRNIVSWSGKRLLVTLGLNDLIIVDTDDALLVCSKDRAQDVKKIVELLKQQKFHAQI